MTSEAAPPAFRRATAADWPAIETLLVEARLPLDGARDHLDTFLVGVTACAIVCCGGLEIHEDAALLRSVVVAPHLRGTGAGDRLAAALAELARSQNAAALYLLTTTAAPFFAKRGFTQVERASVPPALHRSREFQGACPASATLMALSLNGKELP